MILIVFLRYSPDLTPVYTTDSVLFRENTCYTSFSPLLFQTNIWPKEFWVYNRWKLVQHVFFTIWHQVQILFLSEFQQILRQCTPLTRCFLVKTRVTRVFTICALRTHLDPNNFCCKTGENSCHTWYSPNDTKSMLKFSFSVSWFYFCSESNILLGTLKNDKM